MNEAFELLSKSHSSKDFQNTKLRIHFEMNTTIEEELSEDSTPDRRVTRSTADSKLNDSIVKKFSFEKSYIDIVEFKG